jgi:hypothetical protein
MKNYDAFLLTLPTVNFAQWDLKHHYFCSGMTPEGLVTTHLLMGGDTEHRLNRDNPSYIEYIEWLRCFGITFLYQFFLVSFPARTPPGVPSPNPGE